MSSAWPARGPNIVPEALSRGSACGHPAWWGLMRARARLCWLLASGSLLDLAPPCSELLQACGASGCSSRRCPLWVVGFGLVQPASQAHRLVEGLWVGFQPLQPPRLRATAQFVSCTHIEVCSSRAPALCAFTTHFLACPGLAPSPTGSLSALIF